MRSLFPFILLAGLVLALALAGGDAAASASDPCPRPGDVATAEGDGVVLHSKAVVIDGEIW